MGMSVLDEVKVRVDGALSLLQLECPLWKPWIRFRHSLSMIRSKSVWNATWGLLIMKSAS